MNPIRNAANKERPTPNCNAGKVAIELENLKKLTIGSISKISTTVDSIREKVEKEKSKFFLRAQVTGTFIVLLAWFLQNYNINSTNGEILRLQNIRNDIKDLNTSAMLTQAKIDLYENIINKADTDIGPHTTLVEAYGDYCMDLLVIRRITLEGLPRGLMIDGNPFDEDLKAEYIKQFKQDSTETDRYKWTFDLHGIQEWTTALKVSNHLIMNTFAQANADNKKHQEKWKDILNSIYIIGYIIGSILILIGLCKDFKKISYFKFITG